MSVKTRPENKNEDINENVNENINENINGIINENKSQPELRCGSVRRQQMKKRAILNNVSSGKKVEIIDL